MRKDREFLDQFEIGGTFFELIEFSLYRTLTDGSIIKGIYGVNVAKVREVVHMPKINPLASRIAGVSGIFELRGVPIPAINLRHILGDVNAEISQEHQIIVTEFSEKRAGFIVSSTHRIRRVTWEKVLPPSSDNESCMSGMILIEENEFLFILDLEKILSDIEAKAGFTGFSPYSSAGPSQLPGGSPRSGPSTTAGPAIDKNAPGLLLVDDSQLVINNISRALRERGFRVETARNGLEGLKKLQNIVDGISDFGRLHIVITDVEMPLMDGLTMAKKIRENNRLKGLPVLLYTSLSGEVTQNAADSVGAAGYIVKNDVPELFAALDDILAKNGFTIG